MDGQGGSSAGGSIELPHRTAYYDIEAGILDYKYVRFGLAVINVENVSRELANAWFEVDIKAC